MISEWICDKLCDLCDIIYYYSFLIFLLDKDCDCDD